MESVENPDMEDLNLAVTPNTVDAHESKQNSSVSSSTSDVLGGKKLSFDVSKESKKQDLIEIEKRKVSHVDGHVVKQEQEIRLNNVNNIHAEDPAKSTQGDQSLPSSNQNANEQKHTEPVTKKMAAEEIINKRKEVLENLNQTMSLMANVPFRHLDQKHAPFTKEFRQCILKLAKSYFIFKTGEVPYTAVFEYRSEIGQALIRNGIVKIMCDVLSDGLKRKDFIADNGTMVNEYWFPLKNILLTLLNFTDLNEMVRVSVTNHPDVLTLLVQLLNEWQNKHLNEGLSEDQNKMIKWTLSIFHNCAGTDDNVPRLRDIEVIQVVIPYLDSTNENIRLSSISVLALLVNEEEAELLGTHVSIFQFMIKKLGKALKKEDRKDLGWSAAELTTAIGRLARNDANKKVLVHEGCLPLLVELLRTGDEKEIKEALRCIWTLSFDKENKKRMVAEPGMVKAVYEMYHTLNGSLRHDCQGILWSLRDELLTSPEYKSLGEEMSNINSRTVVIKQGNSISRKKLMAPKTQGHVMISYQWANQEVIKQICQELRCHGVRVWIDIDYMGGSTLQAMAKAVEDSYAVIIAMSQKYKDSPNTRAEAEYTFQQRKTIIPLIMQKGYRPDGWLGLILGTKFYYDFSGKYTYESRMNALLGAVKAVMEGDHLNGHGEPESASPSSTSQTAAEVTGLSHTTAAASHASTEQSSRIDEQAIKTWTKGEITMWLTKYSLESSSLLYLTGEEIIFLHKLRYEAPEFFYHCLESKLHLESLLDLSRATDALADLTW